MKKAIIKSVLLLSTFSLSLLSNVRSQSMHTRWVNTFGSSAYDNSYGLAIDKQGYIYESGYYSGTVTLGSGANAVILVANSSHNSYVAKYDSTGLLIWAKDFQGGISQTASQIAFDSNGEVLVVGRFKGTVDFDPGPGQFDLSNASDDNIFICKLTKNGNFLWAKQIGGQYEIRPMSLVIDTSNNITISGDFSGTVNFNSNGSALLSAAGGNSDKDLFVLRLDSQGNYLWAKRIGTSGYDEAGSSMQVDQDGAVYVSGFFRYFLMDFDPNIGTKTATHYGNSDAFILKLDKQGNFVWVKSFGGSTYDNMTHIRLDSMGHIYAVGRFSSGTADMDPGSGIALVTNSGSSYDIFIVKLDTSGQFIWAKSIGGPGDKYGHGGYVNSLGELTISGEFHDSIDVDPGPAILRYISPDQNDAFVVQLDVNGNYKWSKHYTGGSSITSYSVTGYKNYIVLSGVMYEGYKYYFGPGLDSLSSQGRNDPFLAQIGPCLNQVFYDTIRTCDSLQWKNEQTYYISGNLPLDTLVNRFGCDSVVQHYLQINYADSTMLHVQDCDSYYWALSDQSYHSSGIYSDTLQTSLGCDSIVYLNLSIQYSTLTKQLVTGCDSYFWVQNSETYHSSGSYYDTLTNAVGCDSIIQLDLTIFPIKRDTIQVVTCDSYFWPVNQQIYNSSGLYQDTLVSSTTCDSIIWLDLNIKKSTAGNSTVRSCERYTSPSGKYVWTNSGIYLDTISNAANCDSVISIDLQILEPTFDTISVSVCDTFISPSGKFYFANGSYMDTIQNVAACDSIIRINLTVMNSYSTVQATACSSFTSPSGRYSYTQSGQYTDTIGNSSNCDSIISISLTLLNSYSNIQVSTCEKYITPSGKLLQASGTYSDTIQNSSLCDSIITIDLQIKQPTSAQIYDTNCVSYLSPSGKYTWTSTGVYLDTIPNVQGCDSIISIHLIINNPTNSTLNLSSCDSLISPSGRVFYNGGLYHDTIANARGCDSLITFFLTINSSFHLEDTIVACNQYTLRNGQTIFNSGQYISQFQSQTGCDSSYNTVVTIIPIDTSVTKLGNQLIANQNGVQYQWLDCNSNFAAIPNATGQMFLPTFNGLFAVEISQLCADTSACIPVILTGIENETINLDEQVVVYPTYSDQYFYIENFSLKHLQAKIFDSRGRMIKQFVVQDGQNMKFEIPGAEAMYFLELSNGRVKQTLKLFKL